MATASLLFLYAGLLGWMGDCALSRARWTAASPRLALWMWHAIAAGVLLALSWAMILLAHDVMEHGFASLMRADKTRIHLAYGPEAEVPWYWNATIVVLLGGVTAFLLAALRRKRWERAAATSHDLAVSSRFSVSTGAAGADTVGVCVSPTPAIYCLPGRRRSDRVRVTTGALDLLDRNQLLAAIEHERAHLRCCHHLQVLLADCAVAALGWSRLLRHYPRAVRELVEYQADDHAVQRYGARTVAGALLTMCEPAAASSAPGMSWTGGTPAARIRRLITARHHQPGALLSGLGVIAVVAIPIVPSAAALAPAVSVANTESVPATSNFDHHR